MSASTDAPGTQHGEPTRPATAAVVGGGTMGQGIAVVLALAGLDVALVDADDARTAKAVAAFGERVGRYAAQGLLSDEAAARAARVAQADGLEDAVAGADLVIEAVPEQVETKLGVLATLSGAAGPETVITTNTSSLPIDTLAAGVHDPGRFLGVHWFNPPEWIPGVEVIAGEATRPEVCDRVESFLGGIGKQPVRVGSAAGFVANRLQFALVREAILCWQDGVATPEEIDAVVTSTFSWRLPFFGPFATADLAGLDVCEAILGTLEQGLGERFAAPEVLRDLVAEGRVGTKAGKGFFSYADGDVEQLAAVRDRCLRALGQVVRDSRGDAAGGGSAAGRAEP